MAQAKQGKMSAEMSTAAENYWDYVPAMLSSALRSNRDIDEYIKRYRGLIDFGIAPAQLAQVKHELPVLPTNGHSLKILFISDWMSHFIRIVTKQEERGRLLEREKKLSKQMKIIVLDIQKLQKERKRRLDGIFDFSEYRGRVYKQLISSLPLVDKIKYDSMLKNEASSRGRYFAVEERRTFAAERQWIAAQERKIEALLGMIEEREARMIMASIFSDINEHLSLRLALRHELDISEERRYALEEEIAAIPLETITGRISGKILRLKTVITEEIERVGGETGAFREATDSIISVSDVDDEFRRIIEFDREIFANGFTAKFGRPAVLLIPGKGDGMYDPTDNLFILPMLPNFNLGDSIAAAIVAYRLHHDDNKQFIRSYGKIPINSNIAMGYTLKSQLVKSYSKWINMEYNGYRVLDKDERKWFARTCAPKRVDFYYPFELVKGGIHGEEFDELTERINSGLLNGTISDRDLWFATVISCKRGEYEKAELQIKKLLKKSAEYIFAYFNLGVIAVKTQKSKEAMELFTTFIKKNPPKWWAGVAQEHIVVLKNEKKKA